MAKKQAKKLTMGERMIRRANTRIQNLRKKLSVIETAAIEACNKIKVEIAEQQEILNALGSRKRK